MRDLEVPSSEGELIFYSDECQGRELKNSFISVKINSLVNMSKLKT